MAEQSKQAQSLIPRKHWYVLRAISGKEQKVKEYLDAEVKNGSFGKSVCQVFVPTKKVLTQRNGKKVVKEEKTLPGYVLVQATLENDVAFRLFNAPNVIGFLSDDPKLHTPTPIRDEEANRLLDQTNESPTEDIDLTGLYNEGDKVKIVDGPFSGFTGTIEQINNERKKLKVNVQVFGRTTPLELDFNEVEKDLGVE